MELDRIRARTQLLATIVLAAGILGAYLGIRSPETGIEPLAFGLSALTFAAGAVGSAIRFAGRDGQGSGRRTRTYLLLGCTVVGLGGMLAFA